MDEKAVWWAVTVQHTFRGAGESWTYLVRALTEELAIALAKRENGEEAAQAASGSSYPTGQWRYDAVQIPAVGATEVAHSSWGGW